LKKFLSKIRYANESSLEKIKLTQDYSIENPVRARPPTRFSASNNLLQVLKTRFSARQRGAVFELLINELTKQDQFAVYVTVDNFGALTSNPFTAYRNTENKPVAVEQLQICQKLFEVTSGQRSFAKGGVILSTSSDDTPSVTLNAGLGLVKPDAYTKSQKYSRELSSRLVGVKPLEVGKFSKDNVGSLVETLIEANVFRKDELEKNTKESLIDQKFVLSGNGNPLELLKSVTMFY
jgi:small subunit ribosomal protein S29